MLTLAAGLNSGALVIGRGVPGALDCSAGESTVLDSGGAETGALGSTGAVSGALDSSASRTGTLTEASRVRKLQKPDMPVVPANSSMLIGSSLRFCRERELPLIQLSFEMVEQLVGDEPVVFDGFAFRVEVGQEFPGASCFGNGGVRAHAREQGNVVLLGQRLEAI